MAFETCRQYGDETNNECIEYADQGHRECERHEDQGYEDCERYEDRGYESCNDWDERCCTWWPCSWFCELITWFCMGWVWVSNWVCVAWVWVSHLVCVAWYWVARWVCVAYSWVAEILCIVFVAIVFVVLRAIGKIATGFIAIIRVLLGRECIRMSEGVEGYYDDEFTKKLEIKDDKYVYDESLGVPDGANRSLFARRTASPFGLSIKFFGTNSIFISDGKTNLLIDPYFTRPNVPEDDLKWCARTIIEPDPEIITRVLDLAEIDYVNAILTTHAHYDHALDLAEVSKYLANKGSHPQLYGSQSIYYVGVGGDVPEDCITVINGAHSDEEIYPIEDFRVTFIKAAHIHVPVVGAYMSGSISEAIVPPANLFAYKEGGTYAIYIQHDLGNILNVGSAGYRSGAFDEIERVDTLILGIAGFDRGDRLWFDILTYRDDIYKEVVEATNPRRILFSHWDDFNHGLDKTPKWFNDPLSSHSFFVEKNQDLVPEFMPIWGFIELS